MDGVNEVPAPVFGPGRALAALASINELAEAEHAMTGWVDYDTPLMIRRRDTARIVRGYYSDYGQSFDEHAREMLEGRSCNH